MAAALVARGPVRSRSTEILCVGSFSIVVDSVDGEVTGGTADEEVFGEDAGGGSGGIGGEMDARSDISNASSRGSRTSLSKEETDAKLALFKTEAAARLTELERLLDEHDQIIRELKRSESDSGCINYAGVTSAPSSSTTLNILPITITPPTISRTAPTSPLCSQPRTSGGTGNPSWKVDSEDTD